MGMGRSLPLPHFLALLASPSLVLPPCPWGLLYRQEYLLYGMTYDAVLIALSDTYSAVRHAARHAGQAVGADTGLQQPWVPPDSFKRWANPHHTSYTRSSIGWGPTGARAFPSLPQASPAHHPNPAAPPKCKPKTTPTGSRIDVSLPTNGPQEHHQILGGPPPRAACEGRHRTAPAAAHLRQGRRQTRQHQQAGATNRDEQHRRSEQAPLPPCRRDPAAHSRTAFAS